jgi:hypothetical protein
LENGGYMALASGYKYEGKVDGVINQDGMIFKINDTEEIELGPIKIRPPDIDISVGRDSSDTHDTFRTANTKSSKLNQLGGLLKKLQRRDDLGCLLSKNDTSHPAHDWYDKATAPTDKGGLGDISNWSKKAYDEVKKGNVKRMDKDDYPWYIIRE